MIFVQSRNCENRMVLSFTGVSVDKFMECSMPCVVLSGMTHPNNCLYWLMTGWIKAFLLSSNPSKLGVSCPCLSRDNSCVASIAFVSFLVSVSCASAIFMPLGNVIFDSVIFAVNSAVGMSLCYKFLGLLSSV